MIRNKHTNRIDHLATQLSQNYIAFETLSKRYEATKKATYYPFRTERDRQTDLARIQSTAARVLRMREWLLHELGCKIMGEAARTHRFRDSYYPNDIEVTDAEILQAHDELTRKQGRPQYAPDSQEISDKIQVARETFQTIDEVMNDNSKA